MPTKNWFSGRCKILFLLSLSCIIFSGLNAQSPATFYVAMNGNDHNPGTLERPFKTIDAAWNAITQSAAGEIKVFLRAGNYPIDKGVVWTGDNATNLKTITFSGYKNETVNLIGGVTLNNAAFQKVTEKKILDRLPANARNEVYVTDLTTQGVSDFGVIKMNGIKAPLLPAALELFYNGAVLTIARWPNDTLLPIGKVIVRKSAGDDPGFEMGSNRPDRWAASPDKWIAGLFAVGYAFDNIPVDSIDRTNEILYLKNNPSYGIYSSTDASSGQIQAARKARGYYFYNVLEELDQPGEWWLDRSAKKLYLWPPAPLSGANVQVSVLEQPILKISGCSHLTIQNINFSCTRGIALQIERSKMISVRNCQFSNTGLQAIVAGPVSDVQIIHCSFANTGAGGIILNGGDRKKLEPAHDVVQNCEFYNYSRLYKTYMPAVYLGGVGNSILHCYIHDAPDQAILFGGNNNRIAYNHIKNVCSGFSDMGAVYTGRDPSSTGDTIDNNWFDHIQNNFGEIAALYMDDGSGGMIVDQNLFSASGSGGFGAVHVNGGGNNKFDNNIFVQCDKAFSNQPWNEEQWRSLYFRNPGYFKKLTQTVDIRSAVYTSQYPFLKDFFDTTTAHPRINTINNTICYQVKVFYTGSGYTATHSLQTNDDPGLAKAGQPGFELPPVPAEVKQWPNWRPVEWDKIGNK